MKVSYCDGYNARLPKGHIFPMGKFEGLKNYLLSHKLIDEEDIIAPKKADPELLQIFHSEEYVEKILSGTLTAKEERRLGLPWSLELANRSRFAVQGTLNAALNALNDGCSGNLAGGTHHALPDHGEGFCVFNDVAITINYLLSKKYINRALIIDLDVHQGNGNAEAFLQDDRVFTVSFHGQKNYPFKKPYSDIDIGLPDKTEGVLYMQLLEDVLVHLESLPKFDILFYLAGIDVLKTDSFGRLNLDLRDLTLRESIIGAFAKRNNFPLCVLLSGGYAPTLNQTVEAHAQVYKMLVNMF